MMLPVVRVLVQRAESARFQLEGLVSVLSEGSLEARADGDLWTVHLHLAHALSSDAPLTEYLADPSGLDLSTLFTSVVERRAEQIAAARHKSLLELLASAREERSSLIRVLARLGAADLDRFGQLPGVRSAWGEPLELTLFKYLQSWSAHDGQHEASIRRAILARPDLAAVALTLRRRN